MIDEIFGCVGLTPVGPFAWGTKVNEHGAGIYVIVTNDDIAYIGKGTNLGRRLKQFYRQKDKEPGKGNHKGGRDVFKLCVLDYLKSHRLHLWLDDPYAWRINRSTPQV